MDDFFVVRFECDGSGAVVPSAWRLKATVTAWPDRKFDASKAARTRRQPTTSWQQFKTTLKWGPGTYSKATAALKRWQQKQSSLDTTEIESGDDVQCRKKMRRFAPRPEFSSPELSAEDDDVAPQQEKWPASPQSSVLDESQDCVQSDSDSARISNKPSSRQQRQSVHPPPPDHLTPSPNRQLLLSASRSNQQQMGDSQQIASNAVHNPRHFRFPQPQLYQQHPQLYQQQPQQQPSYGFSMPQCHPPRGRNMQPGPSNEEIPQWAQALALAVSGLHQEVKELKAIIVRGHTPLAPAEARLPEGLTFPLQNKEGMDEMEMFLSEEQNVQTVVNYLRRVGGSDLGQLLYNMMAHVMGQAVAETHRMAGINGKNKFACLRLNEAIFRAVRANKATQGATDQEMGTIIAKWLRQAPDRQGGRKQPLEMPHLLTWNDAPLPIF